MIIPKNIIIKTAVYSVDAAKKTYANSQNYYPNAGACKNLLSPEIERNSWYTSTLFVHQIALILLGEIQQEKRLIWPKFWWPGDVWSLFFSLVGALFNWI